MTSPLPDDIAGITMGAMFAQAQALDAAMRDALTGDCKDCTCSTCETLRGMAQRYGLDGE